MTTLSQNTKSKPADTLHNTGCWWFTKEIQEQVPFTLDIDQMAILPATAEIVHSGIIIGQIKKADFGVYFKPYQEALKMCQLSVLLSLYNNNN